MERWFWQNENIYASERGDSITERGSRDRYWMAKAETAELDLEERKGLLARKETFIEAMTWRINEISNGLQMFALRVAPKIILAIAEIVGDLPSDAELRARKVIEEEAWHMRDKFAREGKWY